MTAVKNTSALPMVLVGPVLELQTTIPVENRIPEVGAAKEKLLVAGTVNVATGTAASAGRLVAS
jgi:hypothetical protein